VSNRSNAAILQPVIM